MRMKSETIVFSKNLLYLTLLFTSTDALYLSKHPSLYGISLSKKVSNRPTPFTPGLWWSSPSRTVRRTLTSHSTSTTSLSMVSPHTIPSALVRAQSFLHADPSFVLTGLLSLSIFGVILERRTTVGKALSAPLATMALALIVANLGIVPFVSPIYNMVNKFLVPLAVPMLLFDSDLKRILSSDTGSLLICFAVGALATIVGTLVAYPLLPLHGLGSTGSGVGWKIACALAARHIGGAINFVAVAETLQIPSTAVSAAIAADNVVVALYFAFLFSISPVGMNSKGSTKQSKEDRDVAPSSSLTSSLPGEGDAAAEFIDPEDVNSNDNTSSAGITLSSIGVAVTVSSLLVTMGRVLTRLFLPPGTSALPLLSVLTVAAATSFPKFFQSFRSAGTAVGILFIQLFFAASGSAGNLGLVISSAPSLFAFSALQIAVHFGTIQLLGKYILRLESRELYLASNANVGGPTTAAAMAQAKDWKPLVVPALMVGILGYATATGIALALSPILQRLPIIRI